MRTNESTVYSTKTLFARRFAARANRIERFAQIRICCSFRRVYLPGVEVSTCRYPAVNRTERHAGQSRSNDKRRVLEKKSVRWGAPVSQNILLCALVVKHFVLQCEAFVRLCAFPPFVRFAYRARVSLSLSLSK